MIPEDRLKFLAELVTDGEMLRGTVGYDETAQVIVELLLLREQKRKLVEDAKRLATWIMGYDGNWAIQHGAKTALDQHNALMKEVE